MTSGGFLARRARVVSVVLLLVAGGTVLLGTTQTWLTAVVAQNDIPVTGSDALPIVQPLALAVLALALVLTLVARVLRYALGALATAAGIAMIVAIVPVLVERPVSAVATTVTEHTGLAGDEAVADLRHRDHAQPVARCEPRRLRRRGSGRTAHSRDGPWLAKGRPSVRHGASGALIRHCGPDRLLGRALTRRGPDPLSAHGLMPRTDRLDCDPATSKGTFV